jgi:RNA polymerase sigma factor (sigma-70 family)
MAIRKAITRYEPAPIGQAASDRFPRFLARIVADCVKDHARTVRAHSRHFSQEVHLGTRSDSTSPWGCSADDLVFEPVSNEPSPEKAAEQKEAVRRVQRALRRLPAAARELMKLRLTGLSLREVAKRQRCPYGRVKRLWQMTQRELKTELVYLLV